MSDPRWRDLAPLPFDDASRILVLAAHPDDETLGAGGLIAEARQAGIPVTVVIVTDGSAAPGAAGDAAAREAEAAAAMTELGVDDMRLLAFADGAVREERTAIAATLRAIAETMIDAIVVAPWRGDGHRDHRVLGEIAAEICADLDLTLWTYPIWLWHWSHPNDRATPWSTLEALSLSDAARSAKQRAISRYASQVAGDEPVLHSRFLAHFARTVEVFSVSTLAHT